MATTVHGTLVLTIAGEQFTLEGDLGEHIVVSYHREFAKAINLGKLGDIPGELAEAIGNDQLEAQVNAAVASLKTTPLFQPVLGPILDTNIRITDIEINTKTSTYQLGVVFDFSSNPFKVANIRVLALGVKVTSVKTASGATETRVTSSVPLSAETLSSISPAPAQ